MEDYTKIIELLSKIDKKQDKLMNLVTKIAKTLHLVPVTEKEERDIQLLQRKNMAQSIKVNEDLNAMENKENKDEPTKLFPTKMEVFGDILGDDFLGGD